MHYRPDTPAEPPVGTGGIVGGVALGLVAGLAWELLSIQTDWRLGFSPPVWEIVVGWLGFSAFSAFVMIVFTLAAVAVYWTSSIARNPQSWDARQAVARARQRAASFVLGAGGLAVIGGVVMWAAGRTGPEFEAYAGFARFTAIVGVVTVVGSVLYLKRDPDKPL